MPTTSDAARIDLSSTVLTAMNSAQRQQSRLFGQGRRAGAGGETVPRPTTGLKYGQQQAGVSMFFNFLF